MAIFNSYVSLPEGIRLSPEATGTVMTVMISHLVQPHPTALTQGLSKGRDGNHKPPRDFWRYSA